MLFQLVFQVMQKRDKSFSPARSHPDIHSIRTYIHSILQIRSTVFPPISRRKLGSRLLLLKTKTATLPGSDEAEVNKNFTNVFCHFFKIFFFFFTSLGFCLVAIILCCFQEFPRSCFRQLLVVFWCFCKGSRTWSFLVSHFAQISIKHKTKQKMNRSKKRREQWEKRKTGRRSRKTNKHKLDYAK